MTYDFELARASRLRVAGVVASLCVLATMGFAQAPPDISRWSGNTANSQAQGFTQGSPIVLTWGFLRDGTQAPNLSNVFGASNMISTMDGFFGAGPGGADLTLRPWFTHFNSAFNRWSQVSGLTYQYEAADDNAQMSNSNKGVLGTRADLRIGMRPLDGQFGVLAFNFFPTHGDMVLDSGDVTANSFGLATNAHRFLRNVLMHEHGHGLGMDHVESSTNNYLMEPFLDTSFDGPQLHDILVAHRGYGDANEKSFSGLGNDVSARATGLGAIASGGSVSIGNDARNFPVGATEVDFVSIDDNTDTDFYSFSVTGSSQINVLLEALGGTSAYQVGPQGGSQVSFDARQRSDMTVALIGTDGSTVLSSSNTTGLGGNESLNFTVTGAGTYFVRVTGVDNADSFALDTQFYGLTVGANAVPEPVSMVILGTGLAGLIARRRKNRA